MIGFLSKHCADVSKGETPQGNIGYHLRDEALCSGINPRTRLEWDISMQDLLKHFSVVHLIAANISEWILDTQ